MLIHDLIDQAYETFKRESRNAQVTLLHPRSRYRSVMLAKLINDDAYPTFYYALGQDDMTLKDFIEGLSRDLSKQHPTFGRHLNMLSPGVYEDVEANLDTILDAFLKEVNELSDEEFVLILDEYDRADDADDIHRFFENFADHIPGHCRLVVNSRSLPRLPWVAMIAKHQAIMLRDDKLIVDDFYETKREGDPTLEVFALGPGYVLLDGKPIENWEGHLPRLLFFFALDRPIVTRAEICQAFWPDLASDQAVNVFHVTKRRLHKALGMDVLVHQKSHYQVNPDLVVYYDVLDFVETLMNARDPELSDEERFESWQKATRLYRGPFLQGHNDSWIEDRRVAFRAGYLEALTNMAQTWLKRDRKEMALKLYTEALDEDYSQEDLHRNVMQLYTSMGRRSEAVQHYQQLQTAFEDQGRSVSDQTEQVYNDIMD